MTGSDGPARHPLCLGEPHLHSATGSRTVHDDATALTAVTDLHRQLEIAACVACDGPAEVTGTFTLPGPTGPQRYVRTRCLDGHMVVVPAFVVSDAS